MLFVICSSNGFAFTRLNAELEHYLTLNGNLGFASLLNSIEGQPVSPGMDTELGIGYRVFYNDFVFATNIALSYNLYSSSHRMVNTHIDMLDTEGDPFKMHVYVNNGKDLTHALNLNLPLLVGGEWGRFYFLVGPKFAYNVYGTVNTTADCTTSGVYERFYEDFYNMPNHQFRNEQQITTEETPKLKWNFNLMAHAEIGWSINTGYLQKKINNEPQKITWFASLYADYGLLNINTVPNGATDLFYYKETNEGVKYYLTPLLLSSSASGAVFNNLNIGVKFTVLFQMPIAPKAFIYEASKNTRDWKRGGTQAIKN